MMADAPQRWRRALRAGAGRAGLHFIRAGYEVVSGLGAVLEELNRAARPSRSGEPAGEIPPVPVRIPLD